MSEDFLVEHRDGVDIVRILRTLSFEATLRALDEIVNHVSADRRMWVLSEHMTLTSKEITEISARARDRWPLASRVALVASDDLAYGILRMYATYREDATLNNRVFRDEDAALAWLETGEE